MNWQLYTAISVITLAVSILLQRVLLHNDKTDPVAFSVVFQAITAVILSIFALYSGIHFDGLVAVWPAALTAMLVFGVGTIVYAKTLQRVEASAFSVLFATQAVWMMVLGLLLFGEHITTLQIIGTLLIFASVGILVRNARAVTLDAGTVYGLFTGLLFGIATTCAAYVGRHTDTLTWVAISFYGSALISLLAKPSVLGALGPLLKRAVLLRLFLLGVFYAVSAATMLFAYKVGTFTLVSPLRQTSIIATVLLALLFLRPERTGVTRKLIAAAVCFVGVMLVVL